MNLQPAGAYEEFLPEASEFDAWVAATHQDIGVHTAIDGYMMGFSKRSFQTMEIPA